MFDVANVSIAALSDDGQFAALAEALYAPLLVWAGSHASVQRHAPDDAAEAEHE